MAAEKERPLPKLLVLFSAVTASAETIKKELILKYCLRPPIYVNAFSSQRGFPALKSNFIPLELTRSKH